MSATTRYPADDDTTAEVNGHAQVDANDSKSRTVVILPPEESKPPTPECDMCDANAASNPRETQHRCPDCNYGFCLPRALRMANYDKRCPHCRNTQWYEDLKPLYQLPDDPPQRQATIDEVNEDLTRDALATIQEADQQQRR